MKSLFIAAVVFPLLTPAAFAQDSKTGKDIFGQALPSSSQDRYLVAAPGQILTSGLVGQTVYNSTKDDAAAIGEVTDVVLDPDGSAQAAIIGVGGFLGLGQKDVAVGLDQLSWAKRADNKRWLVIATSKEELDSAPAFDRSALLTNGASDPTKAPVSEITSKATVQDDAAAPDPRGKLKPLPATAISADKLIGAVVYGPDNVDLGNVSDALMTTEGQVDAFVVDVGGFLGIGTKPVAISIENLDLFSDSGGKVSVFTAFTKTELIAHPAYTAEAYKADSEKILLRGAAE